jgi:microsomal dipeptidase-like Zn-dependent dipeptidase
LTAAGREVLDRMERRDMIVDVAHASSATIDDILSVATRPVVASHTGVRGTADNVRNLSDTHLRGIANTGGLIGIGFWPAATGGDDITATARAIRHATDVAGFDNVALGSDFDGAVAQPIDATGMVQITDALLESGFTNDQVAAVMGGNAIRLLADALPAD